MNLTPRQRLRTGEWTSYEVLGRGHATAEHVFYRARKGFWNYRDRDKTLYEADQDEGLGVLVRVPRVLDGPGPGEMGGEGRLDPGPMRRDLDFELERVLGLPDAPWLPEPLDVVDWPVATPAGEAHVPLLVLPDPHAEPLAAVVPTRSRPVLLRLGRELLGLLDLLHRAGLATRGLRDDSLWLDDSGSWMLMDTGSIREPIDPGAFEEDLRHWALLCRPILARCGADGPAQADFLWLADRVQRVAQGASSAADLLRPPAPGRPRRSLREAVRSWARRWDGSARGRRGPHRP